VKEKREDTVRCVSAAGPLPCIPETRAETPLTVAERQREEKQEENGNRKPTGAKFASGKATSDYFI